MKILMRAAAVTLLVAAAACDDPSPAPPSPAPPSPSPSAAWVPPPLSLPRLAAGAACPVTAPRPWNAADAPAVLGDGPLYPVAYYFKPGTVLDLRADERRPDGSYEKKVRWIGAGYQGPVLVRAGRIDGQGAAKSVFSYVGEDRDGGHYAELGSPANDLPGTTTISGPGCYAIQVDGTTFSTTIVFRAAMSSPR